MGFEIKQTGRDADEFGEMIDLVAGLGSGESLALVPINETAAELAERVRAAIATHFPVRIVVRADGGKAVVVTKYTGEAARRNAPRKRGAQGGEV